MIIYGKQPVLYLVENKRELIQKIVLAKDVERDIFKKFSGLEIIKADPKKAQAMAKGGNHQGFLAEIHDIEFADYKSVIKDSSFILVLHSITDVGNIGAILRTAYALGVDGVVITGLNELKYDGLIRTSAGAIFNMKIAHLKNIYDLLNELKQLDFKTYGATLKGRDIRELKFDGKRALVLGSEESGLPNRVVKSLNDEVTIKMERDFDSLNVSVASAILIDRMRS
jgi:23S rRNA (guanosine2251-2'-O)-methyltransferase